MQNKEKKQIIYQNWNYCVYILMKRYMNLIHFLPYYIECPHLRGLRLNMDLKSLDDCHKIIAILQTMKTSKIEFLSLQCVCLDILRYLLGNSQFQRFFVAFPYYMSMHSLDDEKFSIKSFEAIYKKKNWMINIQYGNGFIGKEFDVSSLFSATCPECHPFSTLTKKKKMLFEISLKF